MLISIHHVKKYIDMALNSSKYHIIVSIIDGDELITDCYGRGIETREVIDNINKGIENDRT